MAIIGTLAVSISSFAAELYNLDFSPASFPTSSPISASGKFSFESVGSLNDALVFQAKSNYTTLHLPITTQGMHYDIHYDVVTHSLLDSAYSFTILLDTPYVRTVIFSSLWDGIQYYQGGGLASPPLRSFADDQAYHIGLSVDFWENRWKLLVDGQEVFDQEVNATHLETIRFVLAPSSGGWGAAPDAPGTYVALDNLVVTSIPEPSTRALFALSGVGIVTIWLRSRRS